MNRTQAIEILRNWDRNGKYVFTWHELRRLFWQDSPKAFSEGVHRLVKGNILKRACRGVYVNPHAASQDGYAIEHIAKALRYGEYNYISLESILSEYGAISQIPLDRLTVMTTGRKGVYKTTFGTIEYTHTKRSVSDIVDNIIQIKNRPLRIASKKAAWRDLKRVGRNTDMVDPELLNE